MSDLLANFGNIDIGSIGGLFQIKCGSEVIAQCKDLSIPWGEDWTFEMLTGDLIDAAQMLLKYGIQYLAADASDNTLRAINSLRCLLTSAGENLWHFIASAYWLVATLGYQADVEPYLDLAYQHVCTCQEDARSISEMLGGGDKAGQLLVGCSEFAGNKKIEVEAKKAHYVEKVKEASKQAVKDAAQEVRTKAATAELEAVAAASGEEGLEERVIAAFNQYKESAQAMSTGQKVSEKMRVALEVAKNNFEAVQKAKHGLLVKKQKTRMESHLQKADGIELVEAEVIKCMNGLDQAARKQEEFPEDKQANIDLEVAEARLDAVTGAGGEVLAAKGVGAELAPTLKELM